MQIASEVRHARVWDIPTRLFHWALVVLVPFMWWTQWSDRMDWHRIAGFALAAMLVFRLFWGLFGSTTARFADFIRGPGAVWRYLRGKSETLAGHNPLGGWSVMLMLLLLAAQVVLGLYAVDRDGLESGPLAHTISFDAGRLAAHWHALVFDALLAAIGLHLAAILFHALRGSDLVVPMLTGRKRLPAGTAETAPGSRWLLLTGLVVAGLVFALLWRLESTQV